jgi:hypothetical protein
MTASGDKLVLTEHQALELISFLTSSAEISLNEPTHYGTLRLVDAVSRMIGFMMENNPERSPEFFQALKDEIDTKKTWCMWDLDGYYGFLHELPGRVAEEVVRVSADAEDAK